MKHCRDIMLEYQKQVTKVGLLLFELLSEALGLKPSHLKDIDSAEGLAMLLNYYPPCPEPELTMGTSKHQDDYFLTVLLQDQIGGLQALYMDQWVDVPPVAGALVINIGDLLQVKLFSSFLLFHQKAPRKELIPISLILSFFAAYIKRPIQERRAQGLGKPSWPKNLGGQLLHHIHAAIIESLRAHQGIAVREQSSQVQRNHGEGLHILLQHERARRHFGSPALQALNFGSLLL